MSAIEAINPIVAMPRPGAARDVPAGDPQNGVLASMRAGADSVDELRARLGEFVGGVFLGPVLQQMQNSPFKTKYSSGGHAEGVLQGQLALELSRRAGRAPGSGFANELYRTMKRRLEGEAAAHG